MNKDEFAAMELAADLMARVVAEAKGYENSLWFLANVIIHFTRAYVLYFLGCLKTSALSQNEKEEGTALMFDSLRENIDNLQKRATHVN